MTSALRYDRRGGREEGERRERGGRGEGEGRERGGRGEGEGRERGGRGEGGRRETLFFVLIIITEFCGGASL